jgi:glucosamine--fructose-6-phosphate aminotransferase (isomerizing)
MCGIVGYVGPRQAAPILLEGLKRLEYRGYDSAGVAVLGEGSLDVLRSVGKLANLDALVGRRTPRGSLGLGHTRWATHGGPSEANAHPHVDCGGELAVIHNGIIENYMPHKAGLAERGHVFRSSTDTEVAVHLIEEKLRQLSARPGAGEAGAEALLLEAVRSALAEVRGAYALGVVWSKLPGVLVGAKSDSPLVVGLGERESFIASDVPALLKHTRRVVFLEDGELAVLRGEECAFYDLSGKAVRKSPSTIEWDSAAAEKGGYRHFMLKEIHEQPLAVRNTLRERLSPLGAPLLEREMGLSPLRVRRIERVHVVACGTSHHAGIVGRYLFERFAGVPVQVETASEFRYRSPVLSPDTLIVAISQSGETADTLAAVRQAKRAGCPVLAICNTIGSAIARAADFNFYTRCGPESGVASTKAFIGQLAALNVLALHVSLARGALSAAHGLEWARELQNLPDAIERALALEERVRAVAREFASADDFLYIGRGINYPTALEGALKLKEISYIHAEGFPAGEMKHGPLALIEPGTPVLAVATRSATFEKTLSNIEEAKARGARLIVLATEGETRLAAVADHVLELPPVSERLSPAVNLVPLQLLAYHVADLRGCDVDQPRNLAKSVTVE